MTASRLDHDAAAAALREASLRVTAPRLAVIETLSGMPHATAEEVATAVRERLGAVSTQAVYDVLHALHGTGLVRRIEPAGASAARYELDVADNHHHLVCRGCGRVVDVACAVGHTGCLVPVTTEGFELEESEVIYWGRCPACRDRRPRQATA